jgi:hypothetical protein
VGKITFIRRKKWQKDTVVQRAAADIPPPEAAREGWDLPPQGQAETSHPQREIRQGADGEISRRKAVGSKEARMSHVSGHTHSQADLDHWADLHNPNSDVYQDDLNNHANQLNPNNDEYWHSRGMEKSGK